MNSELLTMVVRIVLAIAGVIVTYYVIPWLKSNADANKWNETLSFIEKCVESAEKLYTPEEWKDKKEYVMKLATEKINSIGLEFTEAEIEAIVEGFVKVVKG